MNSDLESLLFLELIAWQPPHESCPPAEDLAAWLDSRTPSPELESHLERCGSCRADALVVKDAQQSPPCASPLRERPRQRRGLSRRRTPSKQTRVGSKRIRTGSKRARVSSKRTSSKRLSSSRQRAHQPQIWGLQLAAAAAVLLLLLGLLREDHPVPPPSQAQAATSPVDAVRGRLVSSVLDTPAASAPVGAQRRPEPGPAGLDLLGQLLMESLQDDDVDDRQDPPATETAPQRAPAPTGPTPAAEPTAAPAAEPTAAPAVEPVATPADPTPAPQPTAPATQVAARNQPVDAEGLRVRREGQLGWTDLDRDPVLRPGDRLRGAPAGGVLALASLEVFVAPRARLEVDDALELALVRGQLLMIGSGHVTTPAGEVTVDGEALLAVSRERLGLRVISGKAACAHASGLLLLAAGEDLLANASQASVPERAPRAERPGWTHSLPRPPHHVDVPSTPGSLPGGPAPADLGSPGPRADSGHRGGGRDGHADGGHRSNQPGGSADRGGGRGAHSGGHHGGGSRGGRGGRGGRR